mmetsp:Transcript_913/g.3154  ORF Transcript_913/g.3154 Transcript_913/m.3154 type:complete len:153 (+) Transcript_913:128-586(+)
MPPKKASKTQQPVQLVENYVTLISSDKREFIIKEAALAFSSVLQKELQCLERQTSVKSDHPSHENNTTTTTTQDGNELQSQIITQKPLSEMPHIPLPQIDSQILEYLVEYMNQRLLNEFLTEFPVLSTLDASNKDDRQLVVELLLAANYLAL